MSRLTDFYVHKASLQEEGKPIDPQWEIIYSYTTAEDVRLCIEMLNSSPEYVEENDRKHHSMSAALNQYLKFIEEWESKKEH